MSKTDEKAKRVLSALGGGKSIEEIKQIECNNKEDQWNRVSSSAYRINLAREQKKISMMNQLPNVICTSNSDVERILKLNVKLAERALSLPAESSLFHVDIFESVMNQSPVHERKLIYLVSLHTMNPRQRALQMKGRFSEFEPFNKFCRIIRAAEISYYRGNYISAYLTLTPVIEGIILRWMGFSGDGKKPTFEKLKSFFSMSHTRNPAPAVPRFHEVHCKACDSIIKDHLYKDTEQGDIYANFNRHQASHLIKDTEFANRENCIRLFLLLDIMVEIFCYESASGGPKLFMNDKEVSFEIKSFEYLNRINKHYSTAENELLYSEKPSASSPYKYTKNLYNYIFENLTFRKRVK